MLVVETRERIVTIGKNVHENRAWSLTALSAVTSIAHISCYKIITRKLKQQKWVPPELTPGLLKLSSLWNFN